MPKFVKKIKNDSSSLFLAVVVLGSAASLALWLILILLFSDVCTHEVECISNFLDKIGFTADGLITVIVAIIGLRYAYVQIRQRNRDFKFDRFEKRIRLVSNNIRSHGIREGYLEFFHGSPFKFVAAWKLNERSVTILIRPVGEHDKKFTIRKKLLNVKDGDCWTSRFAIFFDKNTYSEVIQSNVNKNSVEKFDDYDYPCVAYALMYLQQIGRDEMLACQTLLYDTGIKRSNDKYLEVPILKSPSIFHNP